MAKMLKKINQTVGKRILNVRIKSRLSQAEFGMKIGVTQRYISMLENGQRKPSQGLIFGISVVYGVDGDWLRTGRKG